MLRYYNILLFGLFFIAIRVNAEEDIKGFVDFLKTPKADESASYPVISIRKLISPDNIEIYEAEIKSNSSPQEFESENAKPQNSFDRSDEINVDPMFTQSDLLKDVNKNEFNHQMKPNPIKMHYHRHGPGWWPGMNHRFDSKWRPSGRDWPSHHNYGYHHGPHVDHNGYHNHNSWSNDGYSPNNWNSYHDHNNPNNFRPSNNHEHFYHHHPYQPSIHNNEHPNYFDYPCNEGPSENHENNNSFNINLDDDHIHQQTENTITNYHDEDFVNPITKAPIPIPTPTPTPQPKSEVSPPNIDNLGQLFTEIFGVQTSTTEEEFSIDPRFKDESADAPVYEENISQVKPVTPEAKR